MLLDPELLELLFVMLVASAAQLQLVLVECVSQLMLREALDFVLTVVHCSLDVLQELAIQRLVKLVISSESKILVVIRDFTPGSRLLLA